MAHAAAAATDDDDDDAPDLFDNPQLNRAFTDTMAHVICELRSEWRDAIKAERDGHEHALAQLQNENIELKALLGSTLEKVARLEGQVDTLLSIIGQRAAARSAIEDKRTTRFQIGGAIDVRPPHRSRVAKREGAIRGPRR
jgi:hypothetical protein